LYLEYIKEFLPIGAEEQENQMVYLKKKCTMNFPEKFQVLYCNAP
jgi:hypothetical protein